MKIYIQLALACLSLSGSSFLLSNQDESIEHVRHLEHAVRKFERGINKWVQGNKEGIVEIIALENMHQLELEDHADQVTQKAKAIYDHFTHNVISKVCSILKSGKPLDEITLDLSTNFDVKKMFTQVLHDLQHLLSLANRHNYTELTPIIEELIKQIQVEQKKWANPPVTVLAKFIQSIKAYFKR
jgi:hypothetical protein